MGYQANCLIIDIINFDLTIFKSQISVALGFKDNLTWRYCRKVVKTEQTRDPHQVTRKTRAPRAEHLFKTSVFDWCWKIAKECIGQTGSQPSRLRKVLSAFCPSRKDATNSYLPHPGKWWMQVSFPECVPLVTKSKTQKFLQIKVTWYVRSFLSLRQNGWESNLKMEDPFWFMTSVVSVHCHWLRCSWVTVRSNITVWECGGAEQLTPLRPGSTKRDRESKKGW